MTRLDTHLCGPCAVMPIGTRRAWAPPPPKFKRHHSVKFDVCSKNICICRCPLSPLSHSIPFFANNFWFVIPWQTVLVGCSNTQPTLRISYLRWTFQRKVRNSQSWLCIRTSYQTSTSNLMKLFTDLTNTLYSFNLYLCLHFISFGIRKAHGGTDYYYVWKVSYVLPKQGLTKSYKDLLELLWNHGIYINAFITLIHLPLKFVVNVW